LGAFASLKSGIVGLVAVFATISVAVREAFRFEAITQQFAILFGDMDKAKARIADLKEFSAGTPFQFGEIADASRKLEVFTDGVLGAKESLALVGDAAAATGNQINDVAFWVGRAYSAIEAGRPFGEAAMRLQEMGILSGKARNEIEGLSEAGATNAEIWGVLQGELEKSEGGMKALSTTGEGLISTLKDNWTLALAKFGEEFEELAKGQIAGLIETLGRLQQDGSITIWAEKAMSVIGNVAAAINVLGKAFGGIKRFVEGAAEFAGAASVSIESKLAGKSTLEKLNLMGSAGSAIRLVMGGDTLQKGFEAIGLSERERNARELDIRREARAKLELLDIAGKDPEAEKAASKAAYEKKIQDSLAAAQEVIDAKLVEKKAAKALAAQEKLAKKEAEAEIKKEAAEHVRAMRKAVGAAGARQARAGRNLTAAEAEAAQAFEEFLNPDLFRARVADDERREAAEALFQQEAKDLRRRISGGRDLANNLNERDQMVYNVMQARERVAAERRAVMETAENTKAIRDKIEKAITMG